MHQRRSVCPSKEVEDDVDNHVLLTTDHAASPYLNENVSRVDPILCRHSLGVPKEAGIDTGVSQCQCLPINTNRAVLERADDIVRSVL